jgi:hypothetical protein
MESKKEAAEVTKILKSIKGIKDTDNVLTFLHEKGVGMTFDDQGLPILQKALNNSNSILG